MSLVKVFLAEDGWLISKGVDGFAPSEFMQGLLIPPSDLVPGLRLAPTDLVQGCFWHPRIWCKVVFVFCICEDWSCGSVLGNCCSL